MLEGKQPVRMKAGMDMERQAKPASLQPGAFDLRPDPSQPSKSWRQAYFSSVIMWFTVSGRRLRRQIERKLT